MARQPRIPMKSEIEQALLVLEHGASTLVDCGADKRTGSSSNHQYKALGQDFDKSEMSPTKLAKLSHNQGDASRCRVLPDVVLETSTWKRPARSRRPAA